MIELPIDSDLSYASVMQIGSRHLRESGVLESRLESRILLCHSAGLSAERILSLSNKRVSTEVLVPFLDALRRRMSGEPIAYIMGVKEFWSLKFYVDNSTLIPRPDSETLVSAVINHLKKTDSSKTKILDLGTGSGCLLLSILHSYPGIMGFGVDINESACRVAARNAKHHGLNSRASFFNGDWAKAIGDRFDIVISNPPYIAAEEISSVSREVLEYEPQGALFAGVDGLDSYRLIAKDISRIIVSGGSVFIELAKDNSGNVKQVFEEEGFICANIWRDLANIERCAEFIRQK